VPQQKKAFVPHDDQDDMRSALRTLDVEVQACLALSRATLRALASLSPDLNCAAEAAVGDEAERARSPRVVEVLDSVRDQIQRDPAEASMASTMKRALIAAADAL